MQTRNTSASALNVAQVDILARKLWGPKVHRLQIFERIVGVQGSLSTFDIAEKGERLWKVTQGSDRLHISNETDRVARRKIARWSRLLGHPEKEVDDVIEQQDYLKSLEVDISAAGNAAIERLYGLVDEQCPDEVIGEVESA